MSDGAAPPPTAPVAIVVPVFGNLTATRRCLESLEAAGIPQWARVLIIDDCSVDAELSSFCEQFSERAGFEFLQNERNLGFVATVNRGFSRHPEADVIILNSDTAVANDWIARLRACAYRDRTIGTVTPFSNNGTICSYPVFPAQSGLPDGWTTAELDALAREVNAQQWVDIPTAVGFCMFLKRACLSEVGNFDADRFGQGYGEECDFSLRAGNAGWRNVIAADVFVFHEGGASFGGESQGRKERAEALILSLHPDYQIKVSAFIEADPLRALRRNIDLARLAERPADQQQILQEHDRSAAHRLAQLQKDSRNLRRELAETQRHSRHLDELLQESRAQFQETDAALREAQAVTETLHGQLADLAAQVQELADRSHTLQDSLQQKELQIENLQQTISAMEQSRSWRYTAWLRRE